MTFPEVRSQTVPPPYGESLRHRVADLEAEFLTPDVADRHRRALVASGIVLLTASLLNGFVIGIVPIQRVAVAAHVSGLIGASFLIGLAAVWPLLRVSSRMSAAGALLAVYGFCGGWLALLVTATSPHSGLATPEAGRTWMAQALRLGNLTVVLALFGFCAIVLRGVRTRGSMIPSHANTGRRHSE